MLLSAVRFLFFFFLFTFCFLPVSAALFFTVRKLQGNQEGRAFSGFTLCLNGAAHQVHNLLHNGKPQSAAAHLIDSGIHRTGKFRVHDLHKFRIHADTVVLHLCCKKHRAGIRCFFLRHIKTDGASRRRIFNGIGKQVYIYLSHTCNISQHIWIFHVMQTALQRNFLFRRHALQCQLQGVYQFPYVRFLRINF